MAEEKETAEKPREPNEITGLITLVLLVMFVAGTVVLAAKIVPEYIRHQALLNSANKVMQAHVEADIIIINAKAHAYALVEQKKIIASVAANEKRPTQGAKNEDKSQDF